MKPKSSLVFKRVVLYARLHRANQGVEETLDKLIHFLQQEGLDVYLDEDTFVGFERNVPILPRDQMNALHDLMIVVGGDGSLLSASRIAVAANVAVIGINRGHLGFLTDVSPVDLETELRAVLTGAFQEEQRFLLSMQVMHQNTVCATGYALNDVVLTRGQQMQLVVFDVFIEQQFVTHYRADGLILATPTGSTAYALSAGGPIMHPQLEAMVMVPMFSHGLNARPLVIHSEQVVELRISSVNECDLLVSCDGHEPQRVVPGASIMVQKHTKKLRLLHPLDYRYYETLRMKLGWGTYSRANPNAS